MLIVLHQNFSDLCFLQNSVHVAAHYISVEIETFGKFSTEVKGVVKPSNRRKNLLLH